MLVVSYIHNTICDFSKAILRFIINLLGIYSVSCQVYVILAKSLAGQ